MAADFPSSVWDGTTPTRVAADNVKRGPNWRDYDRVIQEIMATQTRVDVLDTAIDNDTIDSVGAIETVTGLSLVEMGDGAVHKTVFTLDEVELTTTDGTDAPNDGAWGTVKLYTFPEGHIMKHGSHITFALGDLEAETGGGGGLSDTADFEIGVGFVATAQAVGFGLGDGTQENIAAAIDCDLTSGTSDAIESIADVVAATYDGHSTAGSISLNVRTLDDGDHGGSADVLKVSGTITVVWSNLGNNA